MKSGDIKFFLIFAAFFNVATLLASYFLVSSFQHNARKLEAWKYYKGLEEPLNNPWNLSPLQIQATMSTWQGTFAELKVGDSQKEAYDCVAQIKAEAQALQGRVASLSASEYLAELTRLRMSVKSLPRIGEAAFLENNPWGASLSAYVWECSFYIFVPVGLVCGLFTWVSYISCSGMPEMSTESSSGGKGGGGGGYYGGGGGGFCPMGPGYSTHSPIIYPMPFSGDGQQSGYPPFGSF